MSSETRRLEASERNAASKVKGFESGIRWQWQEISDLERQRRDAGRHYDAYLREQSIDRRIKHLHQLIRSHECEIKRTRNEVRGLASEIRRMRRSGCR